MPAHKGSVPWNKGLTKADFRVNKYAIKIKGKNNGMWKGDQVGQTALHEWIKNRLLKPELCQDCYLKSPYDLANKSGKYKRELSDWEWLCRSCHMKKDGRIYNLRNQL